MVWQYLLRHRVADGVAVFTETPRSRWCGRIYWDTA